MCYGWVSDYSVCFGTGLLPQHLKCLKGGHLFQDLNVKIEEFSDRFKNTLILG
jgi:hypothetical protein